jgi:hypothetical protein
VLNWLPEFALTPAEWTSMNHANAVELVRKAARLVYSTPKFQLRGEFGELFLHLVIRQVHNSVPAISKIFFKSAVNDTVKGFDAVHVVGPPDDLELWLGEVKFYTDVKRAITDVTKELQSHLNKDYLKDEFLLLGNKVDEHWPHAKMLKQLLANETSLDDVFSRACIPVLLTYESDCVSSHDKATSAYRKAFEAEIRAHYKTFADAVKKLSLPPEVRIHLFLIPLHQKTALIASLDKKLKQWQ